MSRFGPPGVQYSFGPGPITPAVRALLIANVAIFLLTFFAPASVIGLFGLEPRAVVEHGRIWQPVTYLFLHSVTAPMHIVVNMLTLWMFGVDLERRWGTRAFARYYFYTGIGAGVTVILVSLLPLAAAREAYAVPTIGASGAIYGLLLAWALVFPTRTILFLFVFPLPARIAVLIMGALAFFSAVGVSGSPVSNVAHLGGLAVGWLYLKGPRDLGAELRYRMTKWRMARMRRRFDVRKGGRDDWGDRIH